MSKSFVGGFKPQKSGHLHEINTEKFHPKDVTIFVPEDHKLSVSDGEKVFVGSVLGSAENKAAILSTVSGAVSLSKKDGGYYVTVISDGLYTLSEECKPASKKLGEISNCELIGILRRMGTEPPQCGKKTPKHLIINCCEKDPESVSVYRALMEKAGETVGGAKILMRLLGARKAVLAVPKNMYECANELSKYLKNQKLLDIKLVSEKYPQHEPRLLVSSLFNIEINALKEPRDAGYPTVSAELCISVFEALAEGVPNTSSRVTIVGNAVEYPGCYEIPFGSSIKQVAEACEIRQAEDIAIESGGIADHSVITEDERTDKDSFLISVSYLIPKKSAHSCISCGRCVYSCPMRLTPNLINEASASGNHELSESLGIEYCIGCGCCTAVCPAGIDLKSKIVKEINTVSKQRDNNEKENKEEKQ